MDTDEGMLMVWICVYRILDWIGLKIIDIHEYGFKKFVELVVFQT